MTDTEFYDAARDFAAQMANPTLALILLNQNLIIAGALEAARQQGMRDMLTELDALGFDGCDE